MTKPKSRRVLIVEDEVLVAMHLEDMLVELGHHVIGPITRIVEALTLAREADFDFAVLDVNVAGDLSFPVADLLLARNIPFVFATGYGAEGFPDGYGNHPTMQKPYDLDDVENALATAFSGRQRN